MRARNPYTTTLKNQLQSALDTLTGEKQLNALLKNRAILHTLTTLLKTLRSTICDTIDVPQTFDRFDCNFLFSALQKFVFEDDSFTRLKLCLLK